MRLVGELPAGPVAAVGPAQMLYLLEEVERAGAVTDRVERERELAGLGAGDPGLVADAPDTEPGHDERVPACRQALARRAAPQRPAEYRVVPVHREPALVGERLGVAGHRVPELAGGEFPVRLRLADVLGERDRAAQRLVHAGAAGQQRVRGGGAIGAALPCDLATRLLQAYRELDPPAHHRPHPLREGIVAGDLELMPDPDRGVGGVVALHRVVDDRAALGPLRPRSVRPLRGAQPLVAAPRRTAEPAHAQGHRALDVVPGIHVAVRPADRAVALLHGGDAVAGGQDLVGGQDPRHRGQPGAGAGQALRAPHAPPPVAARPPAARHARFGCPGGMNVPSGGLWPVLRYIHRVRWSPAGRRGRRP